MAGDLDQIGENAKEEIAAPGNRVVISAVVVWEIAIKRSLGKLEAPSDLLDQLEQASVDLLPITPQHADRVGTLPMHHRDPFDRLLVAQAEIQDLALVTSDGELSRYAIELVW